MFHRCSGKRVLHPSSVKTRIIKEFTGEVDRRYKGNDADCFIEKLTAASSKGTVDETKEKKEESVAFEFLRLGIVKQVNKAQRCENETRKSRDGPEMRQRNESKGDASAVFGETDMPQSSVKFSTSLK